MHVMTINQVIYRAFSTACKFTVAQSFETVILNFRTITPLLRVSRNWLQSRKDVKV